MPSDRLLAGGRKVAIPSSRLNLNSSGYRAGGGVCGGTAGAAMSGQWGSRLSDQVQASSTAPGAEAVSWDQPTP